MSDLLKEAIADAKAVKETALANAKMALEEAFKPQLQSMLSAKLREDEDFDEEDEEMEYEEEPSEDEEEIATEQDEVSDEEDLEDEVPEDIEEEEHDDEMDYEDEEEISEEDEEMDDEEDELDLESIVRELELELDEEDDAYDDDVEGEKNSDHIEDLSEEDEEFDDEEDDEEYELDESLFEEEDDEFEDEEELEEEDDAYDDNVEGEKDPDHIKNLKEELREHKRAVRFLRDKLHEVNILNAKLLFTNKLFKEFSLDNNQKLRVVETLDRAQTTREIKIVYTTLAESFKDSNIGRRSRIKESASSKTGSTKPSKGTRKVITEEARVAERFKFLAGINK